MKRADQPLFLAAKTSSSIADWPLSNGDCGIGFTAVLGLSFPAVQAQLYDGYK